MAQLAPTYAAFAVNAFSEKASPLPLNFNHATMVIFRATSGVVEGKHKSTQFTCTFSFCKAVYPPFAEKGFESIGSITFITATGCQSLPTSLVYHYITGCYRLDISLSRVLPVQENHLQNVNLSVQ
jgi:hypothetical protein